MDAIVETGKVFKHGPQLLWNGKMWSRQKDGYYRHCRGKLMHRVIWELHNGPIPDGMIVHHKDTDKANNILDNLELVSQKEHAAIHPRNGANLFSKERRQEVMGKFWDEWKGKEFVCAECGKTFHSRCMRAKYCTPECRHIDYKRKGWKW